MGSRGWLSVAHAVRVAMRTARCDARSTVGLRAVGRSRTR